MAISNKDIEILWQRYSEEESRQGISVRDFFERNGVPYHIFEKWYKRKYQHPDIVDCTVVGMRESEEPESTETQSAENARNKAVAYVNITLSNGMKVEHRRLSYPVLITFITKRLSLQEK